MVKLGEVTSKIGSGATPRGGSGVYEATGTAFIRSQNVFDHSFSYSGLARISDAAAFALKNVSVERNDVLICITGESVTRSAKVPESALPARVSQHVAIVRADGQRLESAFLQQVLLAPVTKAILSTLSEAGATRRALTKGHLESLLIPLPPLDEQRRIAEVLGALDDLIDTNERLVVSLRTLQAAIVSEAQSRVSSEVPFGEIALLSRAKSTGGPETPYLGLEHFAENGGGVTSIGRLGAVSSAQQSFSRGDVLYGRLRPYFRKVDRPGFDGACSGEIWVIRPVGGIPVSVLGAIVSAEDFTDFAMAGSEGTKMPRAKWDHVSRFKVRMPGPEALTHMAESLDAMWEQIAGLYAENETLRRTRDELLPLLMSGAVRVWPEGMSA
jgi:type I restriction enzyme S subunit